MEVSLKKKIQTNEVFLQEHLNVRDILPYLYGPNVITGAEQDRILSQTTNYDQVYRFLRTLEKKPSGSYEIFVDALKKTHQEFIKDELEKERNMDNSSGTLQSQTAKNQPDKPDVISTTQNSVKIRWSYPEDGRDSVDYFEIKYIICGQKRWKTAETSGPDTCQTIEHLEPNTEYKFKVRAISDGQEGNFSDVTDPVRTMFPVLIEPEEHEVSQNCIAVKWFPVYGCEMVVERYEMNKRLAGSTDWITVLLDVKNNIFSDAELIENTEYEYQVCAVTVDGLQTYSKIVKIKTHLPAPSKPFARKVKSNSIILESKVPPNYETRITHYRVEYKIYSHEEWESVHSQTSGSEIQVKGLQGETKYVFRVKAIYKEGYSAFSHVSEPISTKRDRPTAPIACKISSHDITIEWKPPEELDETISHYEVRYRCCKFSNWNCQRTKDARLCCKVENLIPCTPYEFKVRAAYGEMLGHFSLPSDPITTKESIANDLKGRSTKRSDIGDSERYKHDVYQLPVRELNRKNESKTRQCVLDVYSSPGEVENFEQQFSKWNKTILLMGPTGSGKTELVDFMVNYILDVSLDDPFRFSIVNLQQEERARKNDQSLSQTEWITQYRIPYIPGSKIRYNVNIIDTPGFGDTRGIGRDQEITQQISNFFKDTDYISGIDAVGFVVPASQVRLTPVQKYVFQSILSIFGVDFGENIFTFITFADQGKPPVLSALNKENIPLNEAYKFNNDGLFMKNEDVAQKWKMVTHSLQQLFDRLSRTQKIDLQLTNQVLEKRRQLETTVQGLQPRISEGLDKLEILTQEIKVLERHESDILANKNFKYKVDVLETRQVKLGGVYCTNCKNCKSTCHTPCLHTPDKLNSFCHAMKNYTCTVCRGKCKSDEHEMSEYKYESYLVKKKQTLEELKKKYLRAEEEAKTKKQIIPRIKRDIQAVWFEISQMVDQVCNLFQHLQEIALKPSPLSNVEYLEILMETEKYEAKKGAEGRMALLKILMDNAELMRSCTSNSLNGCDDVNVDELLRVFSKYKKLEKTTKLQKVLKSIKHKGQDVMSSMIDTNFI